MILQGNTMKNLIQSLALFCVFFISLPAQTRAQTNDYYGNKEAREIIDKIIAAYGGAEQLTNVTRLMAVMKMKRGGMEMEATLYQTKDKLRREMAATRRMAQIYDGTNAFIEMNGRTTPAPESVKRELREEVGKGIMQASLLVEYMGKTSPVKYLGKKKHENNLCAVLQTTDPNGQLVEHYFDMKTYREVVEITKTKTGDEIQKFEAYRVFGGILYPEKTSIRSAAGNLIGEMELVRLSADFDDSVFRLKK